MKIDYTNPGIFAGRNVSAGEDPYDIDLKVDFRPAGIMFKEDGTASTTCRGTCVSCGVTCLGTCECFF